MSQNVNVNLVPGNYPKEFHVSQYDVGRQLIANIVDSTGAYSIPSGATVTLVGTKPSGFGFTLSGTVGSGGVVTFSTTATVTAEYGRIPCEIRITSGSTILGTANCMLIVEESPHPEGTTDGDGEVIINQITLLLEQITQQADRAVAASEAAQASETAAAASEANAATSESNAAASATTAVGAKNDAVAAKTAAEASEASAAESAAEARETLETYAKVDGEYDAMTVGTAKALLGNVISESTEPYTFRQTGGGLEVGTREVVEQIVGGTVAWNQLVKYNVGSFTSNGITFTYNSDGTVMANGTATGAAYTNASVQTEGIQGHVEYVTGCPKGGSYETYCFRDGFRALFDYGDGLIFKNGDAQGRAIGQIRIGEGYTANNLVFKPQMFDLTQMFGSTIADAIYAMEQASAGAGVAWFKKLFNKSYYPYNAGELMSVKTSAHVTTGFNQWDEEWVKGWWNYQTGVFTASSSYFACKSKIAVFPNTKYYWKCPTNVRELQYYDANGEPLGRRNSYAEGYANTTFTTPDGCYYLTFYFGASYGATYKNDICINISWDGERDGEYEAYVKHSYPLDSDLELRGIPKLDANNNLYYDGDTYASDGTVTRRYGVVDLGTLKWSVVPYQGVTYFVSQGVATLCAPPSSNDKIANIISSKYSSISRSSMSASTDKVISISTNGYINIIDTAYSDAAAFKTAMSGVYLVYEKATATTETADPYTAIQVCDPNGTEEWTDERTVQIPVGNVTKYHANLKEKLEDLPAIPSAPSANGTYTLKATVSGGAVTYQWVNG